MPRAYCDWNATAPILPDVAEGVTRAQALANPSSVHAEGRAARAAVEKARAEVADLLEVMPEQLTFVSGGTEAAATLLQPDCDADGLFVGAAEHACVLSGGGFRQGAVELVPVDGHGCVRIEALEQAVAARGLGDHHVHVAVQIANSETGAINSPEVFAAAAARGWVVIADAVQAAGRIDLSPYWPHLSYSFVSAHKIGGPKGVGAVIANRNSCHARKPLIPGGGQEKGQRGGTENVAGIVGFGIAARHAKSVMSAVEQVRDLRDGFETGLRRIAPDAVIFAADAVRLPNTSLFAIPGMRAETALIAFDIDGVAVSSGSACSSGKVGQSHVLAAMGVAPDLAAAAIRVSFGDRSSAQDAEKVLKSLERQLGRLQSRRPAA